MICKNAVLKNFSKLTGKHLCQNLFFNKVTGCWLLLKNLWNIWWSQFLQLNFIKDFKAVLILFLWNKIWNGIFKKRQKPFCRFFLSGIGSLNSMQNIIKSKKWIKNICNLHTWLWDWHFYRSCQHIDGRIIFSILKNL